MKIRISKGVGSSPKMWACSSGAGAPSGGSQVGEFDLPTATTPVPTGIVWVNGEIAVTRDRREYRDVDEWVADIAAEYPGAYIVRADDEPQNWV